MRWFATVALAVLLTQQTVGTPLMVAHRGASAAAPENTLPAFELAWELGADAIEGDFHLTKDGEIVCFHDEDTMGMTGTKTVIAETTLAELREMDVGGWKGDSWKDTPMPTLPEVLATVPDGKKIYVEIKCGPEIIGPLFEVIKASGLAREQIVIISFNSEVIQGVELFAPDIKTYWLRTLEKTADGGVEPAAEQLLKILKIIKADGLSGKGIDELSQAYIDTIRQGGFEFHVWTINDVATAKRFADMGVGSITTKHPDRIGHALRVAEKSP